MINLQNINMFFNNELTHTQQHILKNVSFEVKQGQSLAILGESGSGKTTLGNIIIGLLKPSSGEYFFDGLNPYQNKHAKQHLHHKMSVVFQDYNTSVNPRFTVFDIIAEAVIIGAKRGILTSSIQDRVMYLVQRVGLSNDFNERFPHQLSGGQLQRVCIARAIASNPEVILFDEAISSLDMHTQVQIMDLLKDLQNELNLTYIFITHDIMAVTYMCSDVLFLHNGEITEKIAVTDLASTKDSYATNLLTSVIGL